MSPGLTCHSTSSTSAMPSPMSGILMTCIPTRPPFPLRFHHAPECFGDTRRSGEVRPLLSMRIRRVPPGDALDRRFELIEAVLLHQRHELRAEAAGARRLVHDDTTSGPLHRLGQGGE